MCRTGIAKLAACGWGSAAQSDGSTSGFPSGAVSGTMNMAGNIGSFCTALAFPYLKSWFGSTTPFFYIAAALNVLAIILWLQMRPDKPLQTETQNPTS